MSTPPHTTHQPQKPHVTHHVTDNHHGDGDGADRENHDDHDNEITSSTVAEPFINSPSNISYEHPSAQQQVTTFSRSMEPQRVPAAIDVSLGGAPFETIDDEDDNTHFPDGASFNADVHERPTSAVSRQMVSVTNNTPRDVVHEELEWMRNNMSHINDKIDKLAESLDVRRTEQRQGHSTTQAHDTLVFMLVGLFVLVLIDIFFRAGKRMVGGGTN